MTKGSTLGAALLFNALFVTCFLISVTTHWYRIRIESSISTDTTYFWWTFSRFENGLTPGKIVESNYKSYHWDNIANVFNVSLGLLVAGVAFGLLSFLLNVITIGTKNRGTKISSAIFILLGSIFMMISLFQFIRIGTAFLDDLPECKILNIPIITPTTSTTSTTGGTTSPWYYTTSTTSSAYNFIMEDEQQRQDAATTTISRDTELPDHIDITSGFEKLYCRSFNGHNDELLIGTNIRWGPYIGFYVLTGGTVFGIIASIITFLA